MFTAACGIYGWHIAPRALHDESMLPLVGVAKSPVR